MAWSCYDRNAVAAPPRASPPKGGPARIVPKIADRKRSGVRTPSAPPGGGVQLRLAIGKDGLGLELAARADLGPLVVTEMVAALPKVKFPVDVSGGVARFRHRRGELIKLVVELPVERLRRLVRERLRGLIGTTAPEVWVGLAPAGATMCVVADDGKALAFDVVASSSNDELQLYVVEARGIGLPRPAQAAALEAVSALLGSSATRSGSSFTVQRLGARVSKALLPDAGVRIPGADDVRVTALAGASDAWILHLSRGGVPLEPSARVASAAENALLFRECDDALYRGELDLARERALGVLSRAPRHPEACLRLADVDRALGDRADAALAMLREAEGADSPARSVLRADLQAAIGDRDVAANAFSSAGEDDPAPLFAARAFEMAASLAHDPQVAGLLLDRAVARAPMLARARFSRLENRLAVGRLDDAFADAEELEAQAKGVRARHDVWRRAADAFLEAGLRNKAGALYERSLRFMPDDPRALAGLGRALLAQGKVGRGLRLLAQAVEAFPAKASGDRDRAVVDLARAIATALDDKPTAVSRLESIADGSPAGDEARALEANLRAELGDVAGAAFAWARLRSFAESVAGQRDGLGVRAKSLSEKLVFAARFEMDARDNPSAAQRHANVALRLWPENREAAATLERAGAALFQRERGAEEAVAIATRVAAPPLPASAPSMPQPQPRNDWDEPPLDARLPEADAAPPSSRPTATDPPSALGRVDFGMGDDIADEDVVLEARAEELTRKLQSDPTDDDLADELIALLLRLRRSHEVFALISARLDEATPERRPALREKQRAVLGELAKSARAAGNEAEAALFETFITNDD